MCFLNYSTSKDILHKPNLIDLNDYWLYFFLFSLQLGPKQTRNRCLITQGKSRYTDTRAHTHKCCLSWKQTFVEVFPIRVHLCNRRMEVHLRQRLWFHKINHYHHSLVCTRASFLSPINLFLFSAGQISKQWDTELTCGCSWREFLPVIATKAG